jgi:anti-sigma regulatory factor (Ser/Thr protein kinase)
VGPEQLIIWQRDEGDHVVLTVHGDLTQASALLSVRPAVSKHLLDCGRVVVDLSEAVLGWPPATGVFRTALAHAGGWPLARLVLAVPGPRTVKMLRAVRVHLTVPLATSVDEAERLLAARPPRIVRNHELPYGPTAPTLARTYLRLTCEDWDLPDELHDAAQAVITELVTNAVEHARTGCVLHLALDECRLHISVDDHRPDPHRLPQPGVHDGHGYGLLIVEGLSRHSGVTPHDDGKSVWAILDTDPASRKG